MSTTEQRPAVHTTPRTERKGSILAYWLSSTDHKIIGHLYLITSFFFFLCAGIMALLIRIQLLGPNQHVVSDQQYNELFTMHGTLMLLLFATPPFVAFANELIPLQIGCPTWRSAAEPAELLHVHLRRPDPAGQLPDPGWLGVVRLVRLLTADQRDLLAATSHTSLTAGREHVLLSRAKLLAQAERPRAH